MEENKNKLDINSDELSHDEKIIIKYEFLKEKIFENFDKGARILKIAKITTTVLFLLFTFAGVFISHRTHHEIQWLQAWVLVIFFDVAVFIIADYSKYLIESKVITYLKDDDQIELG